MTQACEVLQVVPWIRGQELPGIGFAWEDGAGDLYDFTGVGDWAFELKVGEEDEIALLTSTAGFVGGDGSTSPNLTWLPEAGDFDSLPNGVHLAQVNAHRVSDDVDDTRQFLLAISGRIL